MKAGESVQLLIATSGAGVDLAVRLALSCLGAPAAQINRAGFAQIQALPQPLYFYSAAGFCPIIARKLSQVPIKSEKAAAATVKAFEADGKTVSAFWSVEVTKTQPGDLTPELMRSDEGIAFFCSKSYPTSFPGTSTHEQLAKEVSELQGSMVLVEALKPHESWMLRVESMIDSGGNLVAAVEKGIKTVADAAADVIETGSGIVAAGMWLAGGLGLLWLAKKAKVLRG